jgi:hypothetical protein
VYISRVQAFIRFQTHSGSADARACLWGGIWKTVKSGNVSYRYALLKLFLFSRAKYARIVAHEQPCDPHGQPAYQRARTLIQIFAQKSCKVQESTKEYPVLLFVACVCVRYKLQ